MKVWHVFLGLTVLNIVIMMLLGCFLAFEMLSVTSGSVLSYFFIGTIVLGSLAAALGFENI